MKLYKFLLIFILLVAFSQEMLCQRNKVNIPKKDYEKTFVVGLEYISSHSGTFPPINYHLGFGFGKVKERSIWSLNFINGYNFIRKDEVNESVYKFEVEYDYDRVFLKHFTYGVFFKGGYWQHHVLPKVNFNFEVRDQRLFHASGIDLGYQKRIGSFLIKPKIEVFLGEISLFHAETKDPSIPRRQQVQVGSDFAALPRKIGFSLDLVYVFKPS